MQVVICGWYFRPDILWLVNAFYGDNAFVVKHREGDTGNIPSKLYANVGLEFGAYRQFVENHWDGESDVLFMHDDAIAKPELFMDVERLSALGVDQAYIFHDENEEFINGGCHGRGIWIKGSLIKEIASDFPADMTNDGVNIGVAAQKGILAFHKRMGELSSNAQVIAIIPSFRFAHRGRLHEELFVYRKTAAGVPGGLVNVAQ